MALGEVKMKEMKEKMKRRKDEGELYWKMMGDEGDLEDEGELY